MEAERQRSKPASALAVLQRTPRRVAVGLWRHRGQLVLGAAVVLALGAYEYGAYGAIAPTDQVEVAGVQVQANGQGDCADAVMAAVTNQSATVARTAYRCMSRTLRGRLSEDEFVRQIASTTSSTTRARPTRVGEHRAPDGSRIVYFALDAMGQSVGYMVYLGPDGTVEKME